MNDYETYEPLAYLFQPLLELLFYVGLIVAVVFIVYKAAQLVRRLGLFARMPKVDKRTRDTVMLNMGRVEEWMLASDEELATLDWRQLRKVLDSRNIHCDAIIELTVLLDEPAYRDTVRRMKVENDIRELRLAPLRELEEQADARRLEILRATGF